MALGVLFRCVAIGVVLIGLAIAAIGLAIGRPVVGLDCAPPVGFGCAVGAGAFAGVSLVRQSPFEV